MGHLLAFVQAQPGDRALPLVTQTMELMRNAHLVAGRRASAAPPARASVSGRALARRAPPPPKTSATTACGLVVSTLSAHQRCTVAGG